MYEILAAYTQLFVVAKRVRAGFSDLLEAWRYGCVARVGGILGHLGGVLDEQKVKIYFLIFHLKSHKDRPKNYLKYIYSKNSYHYCFSPT